MISASSSEKTGRQIHFEKGTTGLLESEEILTLLVIAFSSL